MVDNGRMQGQKMQTDVVLGLHEREDSAKPMVFTKDI
jgi:hypothetical protein